MKNLEAFLHLLSSLGFLINFPKSQLTPAQSCKYLGFIFNSVAQSIAIPPGRRLALHKMISDYSKKSRCRIKDFASMIGSLISICPAVQYGLLYTKEFEREKFLALRESKGNYAVNMKIPAHLAEDFQWWIKILSDPNQVYFIRSNTIAREIFSDASLSGWGASCGEIHTHGW